jgi:dimethylglycine dehydrogenase
MIEGDPGFDIWAMDVARYGDWASMAYTNATVRENYSRRFSIRFPNEELPAGRPLKTSPIYDLLAAKGAQFGVAYGLEVPLWYAPEGVRDEFSWRRSTDFAHVAEEVRAVRERVGLSETTSFAKYEVSGKGAAAWLDRILACKLPKEGRMALAPMLKDDGKLIGDFSLANIGPGKWMLFGSGIAEDYHMRWFEQHLPEDGSVRARARGAGLTGLAIAGPDARKLLEKVTGADVSNAAFPFMAIRRMNVGIAPCLVGRVSYTGDLGYELWIEPEYQRTVFNTLMTAGEEFGIGLFGSRALNALRLEKNYGSWAREYRPIYGPLEAGLDRFVACDKKADFVGKKAALEEKQSGGKLRLRAFVMDADDTDVIGDEAIWLHGEVRGWVTSGGYAHNSKASVAMGYIAKEIADETDGFEIELLGKRHKARIQAAPLFDANYERMRG